MDPQFPYLRTDTEPDRLVASNSDPYYKTGNNSQCYVTRRLEDQCWVYDTERHDDAIIKIAQESETACVVDWNQSTN